MQSYLHFRRQNGFAAPSGNLAQMLKVGDPWANLPTQTHQ